ncbi:putative leucine-rich repeat-containing, plant-type, leucine-rich repeat domain superfamily [Arabidopsis thaliana]
MKQSCRERRMITIKWSLCLIFYLSNSIIVIAKHLCLPDQRDALWEFKNEFYVQEFDPSANGDTDIEKWRNNTDCCSWDGVSCDPKTGVVLELALEFNGLNGPLRSNSSLFRLQHLQSLYLRSNHLSGILPDSIGNLKRLKVLVLRNCNLFGKIPSSLGNLSYLTYLDLSYNDFTGVIPDSMGNLNYLRVLSLGNCNLFGKIPSSLGNLSYLTYLDLSYNDFTSEGPDSMGNLNRLTDMLLKLSSVTYIDFGSNQLKGMLPSNMSSLSKLKYFDIGENSFSGTIPSSLFMIPSLVRLNLGRNHFSGPLEIGNISSQSKLQLLNLGGNNFYPDIVDLSIFSPLLSLTSLDVSGINLKISSTVSLPSPIEYLVLPSCNISEFPKFLRNQTRLSYLDISANQIEGQVPEWLWSLPELRYVNISQNSFNGFEGPADVIQGGRELYTLDISSNIFQDPFPLLPVDSMNYLFSSNNRFSGEIPRAICELHNLVVLVLSNNNFSGSIPRCFENLHLYVLHLRNNNLSGIFLEESISHHRLQSLDVGLNRLSGELPKSLINCTQLEFLNVEDNRLNDTFPSWLRWLPNLQMLVLRSNEFHGPISSPQDSLSFPTLRIFDISENHFNGVLSSDYFDGWTTMSSVVDIVDTVETLRPERSYPKSVDLINKGIKMELVGSSFTIYKTIDVSGNRLEGDIPESIGLLNEVIVLNMSNNAFTGHIPPSLSNLSNLQSLDLSQNRLSGSIPPELGKLTFLARMNFSYNMLEGPIPQATQIQTQDSSSFTENPGLCGAPLLKKCGGEEEATKQEQDEEKEEEEQVLSWIAAAIGYVPGVVCGLTIGHILVSHKRDWFMRIVSLFT